jgi:hypothetical protein
MSANSGCDLAVRFMYMCVSMVSVFFVLGAVWAVSVHLKAAVYLTEHIKERSYDVNRTGMSKNAT